MSDVAGMDIPTLIEMAGGPDRLADRLGIARTTIYDWKRLGFVPGNRIPQISSELGIAAADLMPLVRTPEPRTAS